MSELWIPQPDKKPDVANLYDMMLVFQEHVDTIETPEGKVSAAKLAVKALTRGLETLSSEERQISVVTDMAIIDSAEDENTGLLVEHVGLHGYIDEVRWISLNDQLMVSLNMDVVNIFRKNTPEEPDMLLRGGKAPISSVNYIETLAAS